MNEARDNAAARPGAGAGSGRHISLEGTLAAARKTFVSLQDKNYSYLWTGMMGSWLAMQMQQVARGYLAYKMTGTAVALGWVTLSMGIPRMVLSPLGGVLADRFPKRKVIMVTQTLQALVALAHALFIQFDLMSINVLIALGFLQGITFSLNMPARQAIIPEIVGSGSSLANAVALNNAGVNMMRVVGPSIAGILLGVPSVDVKGVFYIMSLCYVWAVYSTSRLTEVKGVVVAKKKRVSQDLKRGFEAVAGNSKLLALMGLGFIPLAIGMPYQSLMPVFALNVMGLTSRGLGVLLTVVGIGGLAGSLMIAYLSDYRNKARLQLVYGVTFGVLLVCFSVLSSMKLFLPVLVVLAAIGVVGDGYMSINSTLIMTNTDADVYGRVMGVYMIVQSIRAVSVMPVSALADAIGAPMTIGLAGAVVAVFVFGVAVLYPKYKEIG